MKVLLFEDSGFKNMFPLNMMRAVYDVRTGAFSVKERTEKLLGKKYELILHCRNYLSAYLSEIHRNKINLIQKDEYLMLNGNAVLSEKTFKYLISDKEKNTVYTYKNEIVAAFVSKEKSDALKSFVENKSGDVFSVSFFSDNNFKQKTLKNETEVYTVSYPWDILKYILHGGLNSELEFYLTGNKNYLKLKDNENFINRKRIFVSKSANLKSGVVLDASDGIIVINENSVIEPFTYIKGPAFIGRNTLVKAGTRIYGPCSIGEYSKVSGEIAESVFHSYVNKQHDGFTGHSYICPFVNLGADTVTSDLKNNYSGIRVKTAGGDTDTGMRFLGSIIGDHSKTSINTMLNTGSVIGIFANIFGGGFPDKNIDSFSWFDTSKSGENKAVKYELQKAIETAGIVMERRGLSLSRNYEDLMKFYC